MKLKVYTADGSSASEKEFDAIREFEGDKGLLALKQAVLALQANRRQGTVSTKTMGTVSGTGKKPFRQKGSGTARQGTRRAPQMRGGAVAMGPQPRDWSQKVNKKARKVALQRALFDRVVDGDIDVIERFEAPEKPKTKEFNAIVNRIAPKGNVLVVDDAWADTVALSARNIGRLEVTSAATLNCHDLCLYDKFIITEQGLNKVLDRANAR